MIEKLNSANDNEKISLLLEFTRSQMENMPDKSLFYARQALDLAKKTGDTQLIVKSLNRIGGCHYVNAQYREAIQAYLEGLKYRDRITDTVLIANLLTNVGMVHNRLSEYRMAEKYHLRALELRKKHNQDPLLVAGTLNNLGMAYGGQKKYYEALEQYRQAQVIYRKAGHLRGAAAVINNIADNYRLQEKFTPALKHYLEALPIYRQIGLNWGVSNTLRNIGEVYINIKKLHKAREYLEEALQIAREIKSKQLLAINYELLFNLYREMRDFKKALEYHKKSTEIDDIIHNEKVRSSIARMDTQHEAENKEHQLHLLRRQQESEQQQRILLLLGALLCLGILVILYSQYHIKKKINRLLQQKEAKYHALFSNAGDAIFLADADGFVDCNQKALEMFGITREELSETSFFDFSPPLQPDNRDSMEAGKEKIHVALAGEPQQYYWRHIHKDGTPIETMISLIKVIIDGKPLIQAIIHDIGDRKQLEDERIRSARLETAGTWAAGIAHDFSNLLAIMLGNLELAESETAPGDTSSAFLSQMKWALETASERAATFRKFAEKDFTPTTTQREEEPSTGSASPPGIK